MAITAGLLLTITLIIFYFARGFYFESYCTDYGKKVTKVDTCLPPTEEEKDRFEGISCIYASFRAKRECFKEQKVFFIF